LSSSAERDAIVLESVSRSYPSGDAEVTAVCDVTLRIPPNEMIAVTGPSGSGKTTLLNLIGGLDRATRGALTVMGERLDLANEAALTRFRARVVGIVFQEAHLLPGLTALENVVVAGLPHAPAHELRAEATMLLESMGLADRLGFPPSKLSAGQRQRVAIARALLMGRPVLLADEPTGNLDASSTEDLLAVIAGLREDRELTVVVATHDPAVASFAERVVRLVDGRLDGESRFDRVAPIERHELSD